MAKEKEVVEKSPKYFGRQLLKMDKYKTAIARLVIKPDTLYSFEEVDEAINNTLRKRG